MPWDLSKRDGKWCVVKRGATSPVPGGCHATRADAIKHQRALYANEKMSTEVTEMAAVETEAQAVENTTAWEGPLGLVGYATADKRILLPGEITARQLPLPLNVQIQTGEGHDNSYNAGRIDNITLIPVSDIDEATKTQFALEDLPDEVEVIWGEGVLDDSPAGLEAARVIGNGYGVSLDLPPDRYAIVDAETLQEIPEDEIDMDSAMNGKYLTGFGGKIGGATLVNVGAFETRLAVEADGVGATVTSSATLRIVEPMEEIEAVFHDLDFTARNDGPHVFVASGGLAVPLKPPHEWMQDPSLNEPTPLTYTDEGRVYGHLALWDSCHTGYTGVCVAPPASPSDYSYFNTGLIETDQSEVPCGKLMFSMNGGKHASLEMGAAEASKHYDDSSKVGAYVRAGSDMHGIWLAGTLKPGLSEIELQHLKLHPPSGDWRGVGGASELVAAFSVPVGGFPIPQAQARLVASAGVDEIAALILAPMTPEDTPRARRRAFKMLSDRAFMRGVYSDGFRDVSSKERKRLAATGAAMPDGSFPIASCSDAKNAERAIGRTSPAKRTAVKRHILRRKKALGCTD